MSIVLLDPRFPKMIPVEAVPLLSQDVAYTEEVPVRVRWMIADLGGHTVEEADLLITTDLSNELVTERLDSGEELIKAPSLLVDMEPTRELEAPGAYAPGENTVSGGDTAPGENTAPGESGTVVDGVVVGTDEHTAAVAGASRTTRTEVPAAVMDELEDAIALMARALRQGEWEQSMTHESLLQYLREETDELSAAVAARRGYVVAIGQEDTANEDTSLRTQIPEFIEHDLCRELSDVLLQVLFHAELANRRGSFDIGHVAAAFSDKLRSRAPYLFEEIEREVQKDEQDKLWAEGKQREAHDQRQALAQRGHARDYETYEYLKQEARRHLASAAGTAKNTRSDTKSSASAAEGTGSGTESAAATATEATINTAASATASALTEAEKAIAEARAAGLRDTEIPTDIRFPMVGLELDSPGEAEQRLREAVEAFRADLARHAKG